MWIRPRISPGLEGVYVTDTTVCKVDGKAGKLYYRGYPVEALAAHSNFEEVCYLLLYGKLPTIKQLSVFKKAMVQQRELPDEVIELIQQLVGRQDAMDTLRTAVSMLSAYDKRAYESSEEANIRKSISLISKGASIVAMIGRLEAGNQIIEPDSSLAHVDNFMYMLHGKLPDRQSLKAIETMFMLHAEHGLNASTFATMVAGSTLSDLYAAITAGIATLKGPLHGEADEKALEMLYAIGKPSNTEHYIQSALAGKQRIMGFGHRIYKTYDPRARIMREYLARAQMHGTPKVKNLIAIAFRAEKMMIDKLSKSHGIWPNVDFFAGPIYVSAGIPIEIFTPIFAASRMAGWCAHMIEYWKHNRLIRPLDNYTGELDLPYTPISKRR